VTDEQKVSDARGDLPYLTRGIYVDNASVSPLPLSVRTASDHDNMLLVALMRSGEAAKARALLDRRPHRRPSPRDTRWHGLLGAA
jgi:hypothetical protein